jgi:HSP20 family protein
MCANYFEPPPSAGLHHARHRIEEAPMAIPVRRPTSHAAPVARFDPFREFEELQAATGQLLEELWSHPGANGGAIWAPPVDIEETDDAWIVEAELPGVDKKDINVDVNDGELTISGDIKERERKGILRRRTRRVGRFEFRVTLPGGADPEHVDANAKDGVLTVRIPKPDQAQPHRIEVTSD